jgi:2-polyprenyl-3-methyl-5-hydroxy-6-metoxy-1,4-benzoquinol methylase
VCGHDPLAPVPIVAGLFRCPVCGVRSTGSRSETVFDESYYARNYGHPGRAAAYADVVDRVGAITPKSARVLDVGCGAGYLVTELRDRGYDALGVDPSDAARRAAAKREVDALPSIADAGPELFAAVFLVDVVAHVADARALARAAIGALAPDGILVVRTPSVTSALVVAEAAVTLGGHVGGSPLLHRSSRVHHFDTSSLTRALALWGLSDVAANPVAETIVRDEAHPTAGAIAQRVQRMLARGGSLLAIGYRR